MAICQNKDLAFDVWAKEHGVKYGYTGFWSGTRDAFVALDIRSTRTRWQSVKHIALKWLLRNHPWRWKQLPDDVVEEYLCRLDASNSITLNFHGEQVAINSRVLDAILTAASLYAYDDIRKLEAEDPDALNPHHLESVEERIQYNNDRLEEIEVLEKFKSKCVSMTNKPGFYGD